MRQFETRESGREMMRDSISFEKEEPDKQGLLMLRLAPVALFGVVIWVVMLQGSGNEGPLALELKNTGRISTHSSICCCNFGPNAVCLTCRFRIGNSW